MTAKAWRGLGRPEDLDLPFRGAPAEVTTRVLDACVRGEGDREPADGFVAEDGDAWGLALGARIGGLAEVLLASQAAEALSLRLRCPADGCGEELDAGVPLAAIRELGRRAQREPVVEATLPGNRTVRMRRPTGRDLRSWEAAPWDDPREARRAVAVSLILPPREGEPAVDLDEALPALSDAMEEADPLPSFRVSTSCPACGGVVEREVDLERLLLDRLERRRREALREVHLLASRYGWTEAEVMAVPAWRRAEYLRLVDAGGAA